MSSGEIFESLTIIFYNADTATGQEAPMCVVGGWGLVGRQTWELVVHCINITKFLEALAMLLPITAHSWNPTLMTLIPVCKLNVRSSTGLQNCCLASPLDLCSWVSLCWPGHRPLLSETPWMCALWDGGPLCKALVSWLQLTLLYSALWPWGWDSANLIAAWAEGPCRALPIGGQLTAGWRRREEEPRSHWAFLQHLESNFMGPLRDTSTSQGAPTLQGFGCQPPAPPLSFQVFIISMSPFIFGPPNPRSSSCFLCPPPP